MSLFTIWFSIPLIVSVLTLIYFWLRGTSPEDTKESLISVVTTVFNRGIGGLVPLYILNEYGQSFAKSVALPEIPFTLRTFLIYFLVVDLSFYFIHRLSHQIPYFWMGHSAHHSGRKMNLALIARGSFLEGVLTGPLSIPLYMLGFNPIAIGVVWQGIFVYQTFMHLDTTLNLGPLNKILLLPQTHKIHHSFSAHHFNKNFAGILIIWDQIFGTANFENRDFKIGIKDQSGPYDAIAAIFNVPVQVIGRAWRARSLWPLLSFKKRS